MLTCLGTAVVDIGKKENARGLSHLHCSVSFPTEMVLIHLLFSVQCIKVFKSSPYFLLHVYIGNKCKSFIGLSFLNSSFLTIKWERPCGFNWCRCVLNLGVAHCYTCSDKGGLILVSLFPTSEQR